MTALEKWKNDFKEFISELSIPRDDYKGIMEYINEVPNEALEQQPCEDAVSRADALKALDCDIKHYEFKKGVSKYMDDIVKLLDIIYVTQSNAIKALPPVTPKQQPCDDCISRQATVERLCKVADFMNEKRSGLGSPYIMAALFIQDNKDEFPSVTPREKTAAWVPTDEEPHEIYECNACGWLLYDTDRADFKYCPNCGARMVSE